jgi:lipopolysaccharide/colanic/teichoic acid biosynthesis glycosyltransferase
MMKRGFDVVVAAAALILLSPIFLAVAFTVRITSRGSVLFRQTRVGLNGQPFTMLKFRSMKTDTPTDIHNKYTREWIYGRSGSPDNGSNGANAADPAPIQSDIHKLTDDPRITSVGRFLRATSLDELPQFWNVLRGDMSIVGPRPALPYEVDRYTEWHKRRLTVLPGITGAWQVSGRSNLAFDEMVALDVDYIEQWSIGRDFELMLRTVPTVLRFGGK